MLSETEKLNKLTQLGVELNRVHDLDILLERVLMDARRFVNADAGSIYIRKDDRLLFAYTQNDTLQRRLPAGEKLIYNTFSLPIDENSIAGYVASTGRLLNLKDVYTIPSSAPYQFSRKFDASSKYTTHSMITIPLKNAKEDILGILQIINAHDEAHAVVPFTASDETLLQHFASIAAVALERAQMTRSIILRMIRMSEMRDPKETGAHVNRVGGYAVELYDRWASRHHVPDHKLERERDSLRMAAMLHDVGKVAISDAILKKPSRFSAREYEIMKAHTFLGARLFLDFQSDFDEAAYLVALNHHERWDGRGYPGHIDVNTAKPTRSPAAKSGSDIPIFGRIVALADVYDALSSRRAYKDAWDETEVLDTIAKEAGSHFDPELVEIFFACLDVLRSIKTRYTDSEK